MCYALRKRGTLWVAMIHSFQNEVFGCFVNILLTSAGTRKDDGSKNLRLVVGCLIAVTFVVVLVCIVVYKHKQQVKKKPNYKQEFEPFSLNVSKTEICVFLSTHL